MKSSVGVWPNKMTMPGIWCPERPATSPPWPSPQLLLSSLIDLVTVLSLDINTGQTEETQPGLRWYLEQSRAWWLTLCYNEMGRGWSAPGCLTVFSPIFKTDNKTATNVKLAKITNLQTLLTAWMRKQLSCYPMTITDVDTVDNLVFMSSLHSIPQ